MPIPRAEFERNLLPLDQRIFEFLSANVDGVWSFLEIVQHVETLESDVEAAIFLKNGWIPGRGQAHTAYSSALDSLYARGLVAAGTKGGIVYYGARSGVEWTPVKEPSVA